MRIKNIFLGIMAFSMLCTVPVSAASLQKGNVVSIDMETHETGEMSAVITPKDKNAIRWIGVVTADDSGKVSFEAELEDRYDNELSDGEYTVTLTGKNKYRKYTEDFSFRSTPTREKVLEGMTDVSSVMAMFKDPDAYEELNGMGLYVDEFRSLSEEAQKKAASKIISLSEKTEKKMIEEIGPYIIYLKCIDDGMENFDENFTKYAKDCFKANIDGEFYKKVVSNDKTIALYDYMKYLGDNAAERLRNDFDDTLSTALFRSTIDSGEMQNIIENYGVYAGLDVSKFNKVTDKKVYAVHMIGATYNNGTDIKNRYNAYTPKVSSNSESSSSGGGGSPKPVSNGKNAGSVITPVGIAEPIVKYEPVKSIEEKFKFDDMKGYDWANEAVVHLAAKGIISGIGDNMFAPAREITREEFAKLVFLAFDIEDIGDSEFSDVSKDRWSYGAVSALSNAGIISGIGDNKFAPTALITRQDMAVIIDRALTKKGVMVQSQKKDDFTDIGDVSDYAKESVMGLYRSGFISGVGDGSFKPLNNVTRAEAAQIIYNCFKAFGGEI